MQNYASLTPFPLNINGVVLKRHNENVLPLLDGIVTIQYI